MESLKNEVFYEITGKLQITEHFMKKVNDGSFENIHNEDIEASGHATEENHEAETQQPDSPKPYAYLEVFSVREVPVEKNRIMERMSITPPYNPIEY